MEELETGWFRFNNYRGNQKQPTLHSNLGISIGDDGAIRAQNRGQYLESPFKAQFSRLNGWLAPRVDSLAPPDCQTGTPPRRSPRSRKRKPPLAQGGFRITLNPMNALAIPSYRVEALYENKPEHLLALLNNKEALVQDLLKVCKDCSLVREQTADPDLRMDLQNQLIQPETPDEEPSWEAREELDARQKELDDVLEEVETILTTVGL